MEFNSLKAVKLENEIRLVGEISAAVEKIDFVGLEDLPETDALNILNINLKNTLDDESLKIAADRLT